VPKLREELWHVPEEGSHTTGDSARPAFGYCLYEMGVTCLSCSAATSFCKGRSALAAAAVMPAGCQPALIQRLCRFIRLLEVPMVLAWPQLIWVRVCRHPPTRPTSDRSAALPARPCPEGHGAAFWTWCKQGDVSSHAFSEAVETGLPTGQGSGFLFILRNPHFCSGYRSNRTRMVWTSQRSVD